jgi:hypothetical protein
MCAVNVPDGHKRKTLVMEGWKLESLLRSRLLRLALGLLIGAGGLWAFAPYVLMDVATQAAVNAPLIRVSAPADGTVGALPAVGAAVGGEQPLKLIDVALDAGALGQVSAEAARADSLAILLRRQIAEIERDEARLARRAEMFQTAARARLSADVTGAQAMAQSCRSQVLEADAALARADHLLARGFVTQAAVDKARTNRERARTAGQRRPLRARRVWNPARRPPACCWRMERMTSPIPPSKLDRLGLERRRLEARLLQAEALAAAGRQRIADAQHRAEPTFPAGLLVWRVWASPGAAVTAGAGLMDLADCRRRFVEMALPDRRADAVRPADRANIRCWPDAGPGGSGVGRPRGPGLRTGGAAGARPAGGEAVCDGHDRPSATPDSVGCKLQPGEPAVAGADGNPTGGTGRARAGGGETAACPARAAAGSTGTGERTVARLSDRRVRITARRNPSSCACR